MSMKATGLMLALLMGSLSLYAQDMPPQPQPEQPKPAEPAKQEPAKKEASQEKPKTSRDEAIKAEIEALQAKIRREEGNITIILQDAKIQDVVDEFRKQVTISIVADLRNVPDDFRIPEFKVVNVPFREAFNHFLSLAQMVVVEETANIIRIERPVMMSLSVTDSDIKDVLALISKVSNANIIVAPEKITGKVTLSVNNVPWHELLESVVKTLGYSTVREKYNVIRVITTEELIRQMETQVFKLRYISPPPTYTAKIEQSKYIEGRALPAPGSVDEIIRQFPFLKIIEATLTKTSGGGVIGSVFYDHVANAIIVKDTRPILDRVQQIINVLDTEPDSVHVALKFLSTRNEDFLQWGMSWFGTDHLGGTVDGIGVMTRTRPDGLAVGGVPGAPPAAAALQTAFSRLPFGISGGNPAADPTYFLTQYELRMLFRAFKRDQYTRLLQEPTITVLDNTPATIFVGENVPYATAQLVVVPGAPTTVTVTEGSKSPVKVGFQLLVIPRVLREENKIIMTVIPENVVLTGTDALNPGFVRFTLSGQEIVLPRTADTTLVTRLKIDDNQTAVIGGLVVERVSLEDEGLPWLKDIPIINFLFTNKTESTTKDQLIVFITPKIVRSRKVITDQLNALHQLRAAQVERELQELRKLRESDNTPLPERR
jgi:type IV pilus assembly protein PilQ